MKSKQAEAEMLKMLFVVRQIRGMVEGIVNTQPSDRSISESILDSYVEELETILGYLRKINPKNYSIPERIAKLCKASVISEVQRGPADAISECQQEEDKASQLAESPKRLSAPSEFEIRLRDKQGKPGPELEITQLVDLNHELSDENEYLEEKLKEAEGYIRRLESQKDMLLGEVELLKESNGRIVYERDPVFFRLNVQVERLKGELKESSEFIVKNNQEFVQEIQRYNESMWKLQHQVETLKGELEQADAALLQQNFLLQRLRKENLQHSEGRFSSAQGRQAKISAPNLLQTQGRFSSSAKMKEYLLKREKEMTLRKQLRK